MPRLIDYLEIERCPHCSIDKPSLITQWVTETRAHSGGRKRFWRSYLCTRCGGIVTASSVEQTGDISEMFPSSQQLDTSIPKNAREYLNQALNSLHSPAGAVMLTASSVDAMLKNKGYKDGSLNSRINQAAKDHLITEDMAKWAHQIRLDANDQRHADTEAPLPSNEDASKCIEFSMALAQFLFVLPSRVTRGLEGSTPKTVAS